MPEILSPFAVRWIESAVGAVLDLARRCPWPSAAVVEDGRDRGCEPGYRRALRSRRTDVFDRRGFLDEGAFFGKPDERRETPTAFGSFPGKRRPIASPRAFAERAYNVARWTDIPRGGHFAAMEEPDLFVNDARAWARQYG